MLHVKGGDVNSTLYEILRIERVDGNSAGAAGIGAQQLFYLESIVDGTSVLGGSLDVILDNASSTVQDGSMLFKVAVAGTNTEIMRVDGTAGSVGIGSTAPGANLDVVSATAAGTVVNITASGVTTGDALNINSVGTGLTTGSLLRVSSATTGAVAADGIVSLNATGNYTSTNDIGLLTVLANATTAGTIQRIQGNALAAGTGLSIASNSAALTGDLQNITLSGNNVANTGNLLKLLSSGTASIAKALSVSVASTGNLSTGGVLFNFSGAHTGKGFQIDDITATGSVMQMNANSLTSGSGLQVLSTSQALTGNMQEISLTGNNAANTGNLLNLSSSGASNVAKALNVSVGSTGNLSTGGVAFDFSAAHTGTGFIVSDATATGKAMQIGIDALTTGIGLSVSSAATGLSTGSLVDITLTGSNANNDGNLLRLSNTGTLNEQTTLMITNLGGANSTSFRVNDEIDDADATPFIIDATGNVGIGTSAPGTKLHMLVNPAPANNIVQMLTLERQTTGTAADNIGAEIAFKLEDAGGEVAMQIHAKIDARLMEVVDGAENSALEFLITRAGTANSNIMGLLGDNGGYMDLNGGIQLPVKEISGTTTLVKGDYFVKADAAVAAFTITLPSASTCVGQVYVIKRINATDAAKNITIDPVTPRTIDGAATFTLTLQWASVMIISDGSNWMIIPK
jgi:hypothetical protein